MIVHRIEQRTAEWFDLRLGNVGASEAKDVIATLKSGGEPAARRDMRMRKVCEQLCQAPADEPFTNPDIERGIALEAEARSAYEARTGELVDTTFGWVQHDELRAGCSPDGVVGGVGDGLLEVKCPRPARHVSYLRAGVVPPDYIPQLTHQLFVTGARWVDFVSYCAEMPEHLRLFVVRHHRDDAAIADYETKLRQFLAEVEADFNELSTFTLET